jgi:hypothetical protein
MVGAKRQPYLSTENPEKFLKAPQSGDFKNFNRL